MKSETICMWSGPRNLSTAMMRSFENRPDTNVWDEPFFAPWLSVTGKDHPGRRETLQQHENSAYIVAQQCVESLPNGVRYYFQKHMPHHMLSQFPLDWTISCKHFFLIRRPDAVIASYSKGREFFDLNDIGIGPQIKLYEKLIADGHSIPIIDCDDVLADPPNILNMLCTALQIPFDTSMLSWPPGPRPTDGAWAPWWYQSVESSTGFAGPKTTVPVVAEQYKHILDQAWPAYEKLHRNRLTN